MKETISSNKIIINNNEYELPQEVITFILDRCLKIDDLMEENRILAKDIDIWNKKYNDIFNENKRNKIKINNALEILGYGIKSYIGNASRTALFESIADAKERLEDEYEY